MTGDVARDLLLTEDEARGTGEHVFTTSHLHACAACREELAALDEPYALLARGVRELAGEVMPSPAFWTGLQAGLDAADRERARLGPRARLHAALREWRRRLLALGAVLVLLGGGTVAVGGPAHAWAALRALLYAVPFVGAGLGQVEPGALIALGPVSSGNGSVVLTLDGLVAGRHVTVVAYHLSGSALASPGETALVADAVDAVLAGAGGRRYLPAYWQPPWRETVHGIPVVRGLLAFQPLAAGESSLVLQATRLPLAPVPPHPWTIRVTLRHAGAGTALSSAIVDRAVEHHGVRLSVTDVTLTGTSAILDLDSHVTGGGQVVSLTPEGAVGPFAPMLSTAAGTQLWPLPPALTAPVRARMLPRPEFVYGPLAPGQPPFTLTVPAVGVRETGSASVAIRAGSAPGAVVLGRRSVTIAGVRETTPPVALGLEGERRLHVTLAFPPGGPDGSLDQIDIVVGGVRRTVSRDDPRLELPLEAGASLVAMRLEAPVVTVRGPWILRLGPLVTR